MSSVKEMLQEKVRQKIRMKKTKVSDWWDTLPSKHKKKVKTILGLSKNSDNMFADLPDSVKMEIRAYFDKHKGVVE